MPGTLVARAGRCQRGAFVVHGRPGVRDVEPRTGQAALE